MSCTIKSTLACNLDSNILQAAIPLLEASEVEAIEWSFDTLHNSKNIPEWFIDLIRTFSNAGSLIGHGVFFSLFSGKWNIEQQKWLNELTSICSQFKFDHITEHFGFMTGSSFHKGAPLSIPFNRTTLSIGIDRLMRISDACQVPVGLENLAFSFSIDEVKKQGEFLSKLIEPINGFIILDLHNLYCQMHNFSIDFDTLISYFPLNRVREIHISGGSWEDSIEAPHQRIRRDTHDESVPLVVFDLLKNTLPKCRNVQYVVLEQIGTGLHSQSSREQYAQDFKTMKSIVKSFSYQNAITNEFISSHDSPKDPPLESSDLHEQQMILSSILENSMTQEDLYTSIEKKSEHLKDWNLQDWMPYMLKTASEIARKWK